MPILQVIDGILGMKVVKWGLLVATVLLLAVTVFLKLHLMWSQADLAKQKAANATLMAQVTTQNQAVEAWKAEGVRQQKVAQAAVQTAGKIKATYDQKVAAIKAQFTQESCCGAIEDFKKVMIGGNP
jgi:hypothetical protein